MKKLIYSIVILISISLITGCGFISNLVSDKKPDVVINEKSLDTTVDAAKAKSLGQLLLNSVPQLLTLRNKLEMDTGKKIQVTINVQSSPDPEGITEIEKNNYFMYVPYSDKNGLVKTYTFLIGKDNKILVFAENGDDTISVDEWARRAGVQ